MTIVKKDRKDMNLMELMQLFGTDEACHAYLEHIRWHEGPVCPRCQSTKVSRHNTRDQFDCSSCDHRFSVTSGTIFHDSKLGLVKWFAATYLMVEAKKGVSANQMKRTLDISYKTAWYLCHRIRAAMTSTHDDLLSGTVEVDETYIGGKVRGKGKGYIGNKAVVVGAIQRGGNIVLQRTEGNTSQILHEFIRQHTDGSTTVYTDEHPSYRGVKRFRKHDTVEHRKEEWTRGDVHTQSVENVWSLFKRSIIGSYHKLSEKHLDAYLDELEWRFNNRENPFLFRDTVLRLLNASTLQYRHLIAH